MAIVLVTGANGKLGRAICRELLGKGHEVRGLTRSQPAPGLNVSWFNGNVLDPASYASALRRCDAVIHMAAELLDPTKMEETNLSATIGLVNECQSAGVKYLAFASSVAVYGSPSSHNITEETAIIDPDRPVLGQYFNRPYVMEYARTKAAAEHNIRKLASNIVIDILRPSVVRDRSELFEIGDMNTLNKMFMAPRSTQYVLTEDLASAVSHLMTRGLSEKARIEAYNIADENNPTYREILRIGNLSSGDVKFSTPLTLPAAADKLKYCLTYRQLNVGVPLGYMKISNRKLRETGFTLPIGVPKALEEAAKQL